MAIHYNSKIVTDGLLSAIDIKNSKTYSGSGTTFNDLSGLNNNGTATTFTHDSQDGSILLSSNNFSIPNSSRLSSILGTGSFTLETVVRSTDVAYPRSRHPIYVNSNPTGSSEKGWSAGHSYTSTKIEIRVCDGVNLANGYINHSVAESTVYHRIFTVDRTSGATTKYYVNGYYLGEVVAPTVTGSIYGSGGILFGNVWGWRFIGNFYSIKVYSRVLSSNEVINNFNAIRGRYGI